MCDRRTRETGRLVKLVVVNDFTAMRMRWAVLLSAKECLLSAHLLLLFSQHAAQEGDAVVQRV